MADSSSRRDLARRKTSPFVVSINSSGSFLDVDAALLPTINIKLEDSGGMTLGTLLNSQSPKSSLSRSRLPASKCTILKLILLIMLMLLLRVYR